VISNPTVDDVMSYDMTKIYCKCGNIVSIDENIVRLKKTLRKPVECPICRNFRISNELEYINNLFSGTLDDVSIA
jgi:hypothetical protein